MNDLLVVHCIACLVLTVTFALVLQVTSQFLPSITLMNLSPYTNYTVRVSAQNMYTPPNLVNSLYGTPETFRTTEGGE